MLNISRFLQIKHILSLLCVYMNQCDSLLNIFCLLSVKWTGIEICIPNKWQEYLWESVKKQKSEIKKYKLLTILRIIKNICIQYSQHKGSLRILHARHQKSVLEFKGLFCHGTKNIQGWTIWEAVIIWLTCRCSLKNRINFSLEDNWNLNKPKEIWRMWLDKLKLRLW